MKKIKVLALSLLVLSTIVAVSGFTSSSTSSPKSEVAPAKGNKGNQTINMFVTHGHCSTPFGGIVENLKIIPTKREDQGNPLENMKISFEIDPNRFNSCRSDDLTKRVRTPGLFIGKSNEKITFNSTNVYTMGLDWYQVNGNMSIKGIEKEVKLFVTGIREPQDAMPSALVVEGKMNLLDWGIDYDKIVTGSSDPVPTKWLHMNMKVEMASVGYMDNFYKF